MKTDHSKAQADAVKDTKEKFFQFACDDEFLKVLAALAKKHRASKAHVARLAVFQLAESEAVEV